MSVNRATILGRLGRDPDVAQWPDGTTYCKFSLATSERWTDKQGVKQERTTWHDCQATKAAAEIIAKYVSKGDELYVEGPIEHREYTGKDGVQKKAVTIRVDRFSFVGSGKKDGAESRQPPPSRPPQSPPSRPAPQTPPQTPAPGERYDDDDIPF